MIRMAILAIVTLMMGMTSAVHALTSKQNPRPAANDPLCDPSSGVATDVAVAGGRSCYCSESKSGGVGYAGTLYPLIAIVGVYNVSVVIECNPEQFNSTSTTCTRRSDCSPDATYSMPGWMYDWTTPVQKPIFTIEAGPGSAP